MRIGRWLALDVARPEQLAHSLEQLAPAGHMLRQAIGPKALASSAAYREPGRNAD